MVRPAHPETIFHLKPTDDATATILQHSANAPFVSTAATGEGALEIGYHVSSRPRGGRVIARLGRDADLVLPARHISQVHVAFEVHPISNAIMFCVRAQNVKTVRVQPRGLRSDGDFRQMVLIPGTDYQIIIGTSARPFLFTLIWKLDTPSTARAVHAGFQAAEARALNPCWLKTESDDELDIQSWYHTRLPSKTASIVRDVLFDQDLDAGAFGKVSRAIDLDSGHYVAVKKVCPANDKERVNLHREIKTLETLKHPHIVEFLGCSGWNSGQLHPNGVLIFMPLRAGSLHSLIPLAKEKEKAIIYGLTYQILSALDYLASRNLCHRDVKPANILYNLADGDFLFQLADFGFVNHQQYAETFCGTRVYLPPELHPDHGVGKYRQSLKMDIWSLFVTVTSITTVGFDEGQLAARQYADILAFVRAAAANHLSGLEPMARENPELRASAAQMLVLHFDGRGLTTRLSDVGPIPQADAPAGDYPGPPAVTPERGPGNATGRPIPGREAAQRAEQLPNWKQDDERPPEQITPEAGPSRPQALRRARRSDDAAHRVAKVKSRRDAGIWQKMPGQFDSDMES